MKNVWKNLPKPIFALAPMEGVTDTVFRQVIAKCAKPSVFFTEFTNVDGLFSKGKQETEHRLLFHKSEKPIIAQVWGMNVDNYKRAAELIEKLGFDGIDINMGCPEKSVVKRGACAGLIHDHNLAKKIIKAVQTSTSLPVSVKTRIGIKEIETDEWISFLLNQRIDALTVHLRTVREMSNAPAHFEETQKIVELKKTIAPDTIILANGDIETLNQAKKIIDKYKMDGVMMGRGIFKNPYLFDHGKTLEQLNFSERMKLLIEHSELFEKQWGKHKHFAILRKFYKIYTLGLPNASDLRQKLMETDSVADVKSILSNYEAN